LTADNEVDAVRVDVAKEPTTIVETAEEAEETTKNNIVINSKSRFQVKVPEAWISYLNSSPYTFENAW
jgi:hypothetical protein